MNIRKKWIWVVSFVLAVFALIVMWMAGGTKNEQLDKFLIAMALAVILVATEKKLLGR